MAHLVIDGYNCINVSRGNVDGGASLDMLRRSFLDTLVRYKKARGGKITVVFDAYRTSSTGRHQENYKGIDVLYSGERETADEVIIGWIRRKPSGMVVVSSDRAIIDEAKINGIAFLTSVKLTQTVADVTTNAGAFFQKDEDDDEGPKKEKGGNPRRLPKKLRKAVRTLDKIPWKK